MPTRGTSGAAIRMQWAEVNRLQTQMGGMNLKHAIRLARKGKTHPDPNVARMSLVWARKVSTIEHQPARLDNSRWLRAGAFIVQVGSLGFLEPYTDWVRERSMRRDANTLLGVHD